MEHAYHLYRPFFCPLTLGLLHYLSSGTLTAILFKCLASHSRSHGIQLLAIIVPQTLTCCLAMLHLTSHYFKNSLERCVDSVLSFSLKVLMLCSTTSFPLLLIYLCNKYTSVYCPTHHSDSTPYFFTFLGLYVLNFRLPCHDCVFIK